MKVLCVDDEAAIRRLVSKIVTNEGYECVCASDGVEAILCFDTVKPDLVILDVMMPRMDGFQVCDLLRARGATIPIIFLSAKSELQDKETGFGFGGDDYLAKPFSPQELILHINARLRQEQRKSTSPLTSVEIGPFVIDALSRTVLKNGTSIDLTPREFSLFSLMATHPDEVFTREQLIEHIWGDNYYGDISAVAVFIRRLREKIEVNPSDPDFIQTVWHVGYRFSA
ncbi:MAG: response regulator transcription factor [Raoultibacter sp.]